MGLLFTIPSKAGRFKNSLSEAWIADAPMLLSWLSPSGQFLATRTDDARTMSLLETRTMSRCGPDLIVDHEVGAVAWSSTEDTIVTRAADGILRNLSNVFESATIIVQSTQKHEYASIEYSPDDRLIASIGYEKAKLWDASNLSLLWESSGYLCHSVAFHPLEHNFFVIRGFSVVNANVEDLGTIASTKRKIDFWANRLVFDPSGDTCAASTRQGVKILDAKTFAVKTEISCSVVVGMRYTPSGKYLLLILKAKIML
jgi:WD40 repeat protein